MTRFMFQAVALALALGASGAAQAQTSTKDIVLDRITSSARGTAPAAAATSDAMVVSVLLESSEGTLTPRSTDRLFHTGDRFRVKLLTARDGRVALYNTKPDGKLVEKPLWQGQVKRGQELVSPRLRLDGRSGVDQLHVVLQPLQEARALGWLERWLSQSAAFAKDAAASGADTAKDIVLDVQNTESATYLYNARGQGLVTTIRIAHR